MLHTPKIFNNATLRQILEKLLYKTDRGTTLFDTRRDFKNMSVTHLGRIYEGLLEFRFESPGDRRLSGVRDRAATRGKSIEAYFDAYDTALIRKEKGFRALRELTVRKATFTSKAPATRAKPRPAITRPRRCRNRW